LCIARWSARQPSTGFCGRPDRSVYGKPLSFAMHITSSGAADISKPSCRHIASIRAFPGRIRARDDADAFGAAPEQTSAGANKPTTASESQQERRRKITGVHPGHPMPRAVDDLLIVREGSAFANKLARRALNSQC
jgi:hypothetical protein